MRTILLVLCLTSACAERAETVENHCSGLCDVLVTQCAVNSFPSVEDCESACVFGEEDGGADILSYKVCVEAVSDCDTFEIVECENEHGW